MKEIRQKAFINSSLTTLYIIAVATFMYMGALMKIGRSNSFLVPVTMLLLFVFSASITSYLVLGKPAQMYVDGKKKEALSLLTQTLFFFSINTVCAMILLLFFTR